MFQGQKDVIDNNDVLLTNISTIILFIFRANTNRAHCTRKGTKINSLHSQGSPYPILRLLTRSLVLL